MKYTSNQANKLLKGYQEDLAKVLSIEKMSSTFIAATTEKVEEVAPSYDFTATQMKVSDLQNKIRKIKHAINVFNTTTLLPEFSITIDEALVLMPQLTATVNKLSAMKNALPKTRLSNSFANSKSIIEYSYVNYSIEEATKLYEEARAQLVSLQTTLDTVNNTYTFEIEL